jgi:hypothetical protein
MSKSTGEWALRIEYSDKRAEHRFYKTEGQMLRAAAKIKQKYGAKCRFFREIKNVRQIDIFEIEPEY